MQGEEVVEGLLVWAHFGGHAACFGPSTGGGVDQHGFADPAQGVQERFDGQVVAGAAGFQDWRRCSKFAVEFCPASNTTVIDGQMVPALSSVSARFVYRCVRCSIRVGNWVTSGRFPG